MLVEEAIDLLLKLSHEGKSSTDIVLSRLSSFGTILLLLSSMSDDNLSTEELISILHQFIPVSLDKNQETRACVLFGCIYDELSSTNDFRSMNSVFQCFINSVSSLKSDFSITSAALLVFYSRILLNITPHIALKIVLVESFEDQFLNCLRIIQECVEAASQKGTFQASPPTSLSSEVCMNSGVRIAYALCNLSSILLKATEYAMSHLEAEGDDSSLRVIDLSKGLLRKLVLTCSTIGRSCSNVWNSNSAEFVVEHFSPVADWGCLVMGLCAIVDSTLVSNFSISAGSFSKSQQLIFEGVSCLDESSAVGNPFRFRLASSFSSEIIELAFILLQLCTGSPSNSIRDLKNDSISVLSSPRINVKLAAINLLFSIRSHSNLAVQQLPQKLSSLFDQLLVSNLYQNTDSIELLHRIQKNIDDKAAVIGLVIPSMVSSAARIALALRFTSTNANETGKYEIVSIICMHVLSLFSSSKNLPPSLQTGPTTSKPNPTNTDHTNKNSRNRRRSPSPNAKANESLSESFELHFSLDMNAVYAASIACLCRVALMSNTLDFSQIGKGGSSAIALVSGQLSSDIAPVLSLNLKCVNFMHKKYGKTSLYPKQVVNPNNIKPNELSKSDRVLQLVKLSIRTVFVLQKWTGIALELNPESTAKAYDVLNVKEATTSTIKLLAAFNACLLHYPAATGKKNQNLFLNSSQGSLPLDVSILHALHFIISQNVRYLPSDGDIQTGITLLILMTSISPVINLPSSAIDSEIAAKFILDFWVNSLRLHPLPLSSVGARATQVFSAIVDTLETVVNLHREAMLGVVDEEGLLGVTPGVLKDPLVVSQVSKSLTILAQNLRYTGVTNIKSVVSIVVSLLRVSKLLLKESAGRLGIVTKRLDVILDFMADDPSSPNAHNWNGDIDHVKMRSLASTETCWEIVGIFGRVESCAATAALCSQILRGLPVARMDEILKMEVIANLKVVQADIRPLAADCAFASMNALSRSNDNIFEGWQARMSILSNYGSNAQTPSNTNEMSQIPAPLSSLDLICCSELEVLHRAHTSTLICGDAAHLDDLKQLNFFANPYTPLNCLEHDKGRFVPQKSRKLLMASPFFAEVEFHPDPTDPLLHVKLIIFAPTSLDAPLYNLKAHVDVARLASLPTPPCGDNVWQAFPNKFEVASIIQPGQTTEIFFSICPPQILPVEKWSSVRNQYVEHFHNSYMKNSIHSRQLSIGGAGGGTGNASNSALTISPMVLALDQGSHPVVQQLLQPCAFVINFDWFSPCPESLKTCTEPPIMPENPTWVSMNDYLADNLTYAQWAQSIENAIVENDNAKGNMIIPMNASSLPYAISIPLRCFQPFLGFGARISGTKWLRTALESEGSPFRCLPHVKIGSICASQAPVACGGSNGLHVLAKAEDAVALAGIMKGFRIILVVLLDLRVTVGGCKAMACSNSLALLADLKLSDFFPF